MEETDEDFEVTAQEVEDLPTCYFNSVSYPSGQYVCSGSGELLHCDNGLWVKGNGMGHPFFNGLSTIFFERKNWTLLLRVWKTVGMPMP